MVDVLISFDTEHIKKYVFGTDTLKEIRGASSLLDRLNRVEMENVAKEKKIDVFPIYMNGGAGLFLVEKGQEDIFGQAVQARFREFTGDGSSITYIVQKLPPDAPPSRDELLKFPMQETLNLMRYRLQAQKDTPQNYIALPSHPFMRLCDECGVEYGEKRHSEPRGQELLLCMSCQKKLKEDDQVKDSITALIKGGPQALSAATKSPLWSRVIEKLCTLKYDLPQETKRPQDFNVFRAFKGARDYIALIYADGNSMGKTIENFRTLNDIQAFATKVDDGVTIAVSSAIAKHLQVGKLAKPGVELPKGEGEPLFPFDILLLGGDDIVMVTPASVALDVALTIVKEFHNYTDEKHSLSVGVVLAPVKYPFGMLLELAETTLKFAKKEAAKRRLAATGVVQGEVGMINFMTVPGSAGRDFKKFYSGLVNTKTEGANQIDFYATLRPYDTEQFAHLLDDIREGRRKKLGRTKLHQLREAILKMNLTTSLSDARGLWRNWYPQQREFVWNHLYAFAGRYQQQQYHDNDPLSWSFQRKFPWFADGKNTNIYRTSLLDFIELYDFVMVEEGDSDDKE